MKRFLPFLVMLSLLVFPAMAGTTTFDAPAGKAVWAIDLECDVGSTGNFYLYLQNGDTVTGSWSYTGYPLTTSTITIGSDSGSFTYFQPITQPLKMEIWNGDNSTSTGLTTHSRQIKMGSGQLKSVWNTVVSESIAGSPIVKYSISSSDTVTTTHELISISKATKALTPDAGDFDLIALLTTSIPIVVSVFAALLYWIKFLFIDHLLLTVSLYMTGSMAYAMNTSRDIFKFYKTWFTQQTKLFNFMSSAFSTTFQIVTQVAVIVGKAVGTAVDIIKTVIFTLMKI